VAANKFARIGNVESGVGSVISLPEHGAHHARLSGLRIDSQAFVRFYKDIARLSIKQNGIDWGSDSVENALQLSLKEASVP
jgi:hypothetical protein